MIILCTTAAAIALCVLTENVKVDHTAFSSKNQFVSRTLISCHEPFHLVVTLTIKHFYESNRLSLYLLNI